MINRIARAVISGDVVLERGALTDAVTAILPVEAPLAPPTVIPDIVDRVIGLGPLETLLRDPEVSDIFVNGNGDTWVERRGRLERLDPAFDDGAELVAAVERAIAPLGLRLDRSSPAVDARLPDGSRLHAIIPPASVDGPVVAIRRFTEVVPDLDALVAAGGIRAEGAATLRSCVVDRCNTIVAGPTGAGKTTLLNILSKEIAPDERVVTVEDAAELCLAGHVIRLEARPPNTEGLGAVTIRELLRHALRLRPDRIVVGEVRGVEAYDMLQAMSTGHDGSLSTIHASSAAEAIWRLETLALGAAGLVTEASVRRQVVGAVDFIALVGRRDGLRVVESISRVHDDGEIVEAYRC